MSSELIEVSDNMSTIVDNLNRTLTEETVKELINSCNNPELINRDIAPNGNIIYKIYSDGEITFEKGGNAYGKRTLHTLMSSCMRNKFADLFPLKITGSYNVEYGYAIVTHEDGHKIRDALINLYNKK